MENKSCIEQLSEWLAEQQDQGLVDFKEFFEPDLAVSAEDRARDILEVLRSEKKEVVFKTS